MSRLFLMCVFFHFKPMKTLPDIGVMSLHAIGLDAVANACEPADVTSREPMRRRHFTCPMRFVAALVRSASQIITVGPRPTVMGVETRSRAG